MRDGEPLVWRELNLVWDTKFGWAQGGRPTWDDQRYGSLLLGGFDCDGGVNAADNATVQSMVEPSMRILSWPGLPLDLAISSE